MSDTITELPVLHAYPSANPAPSLVIFNNRPTIQWNASTQEILLQGILTDKYIGGNLGVKLFNVQHPHVGVPYTWEVSFKKLPSGTNYLSTTYNATKTISTTSLGADLLNIDSVTFTNAELGYSVGAFDELFQIRIKASGSIFLGTVGAAKVHLLNVVLENV